MPSARRRRRAFLAEVVLVQRMPGFRELIELHLAHQSDREAAQRQDEHRRSLAALDERLAGARDVLARAEEKVASLQAEKRAAEGEVQRLEQARSKYRSQLMEAKTNEVYKTLLHEIETTTGTISDRETQVLEVMESLDAAQGSAAAARKELASAQAENQVEARRLEAELGSLESVREKARVRAAEFEPRVPADLLGLYRRVSGARGGKGMARVVSGSCTECQVDVRPQVLVELVSREATYQCPGCGRILYRDENLQAPASEADASSGSGGAASASG